MNPHPFDDADATAAWARSARLLGAVLVGIVAAVAVCWPLLLSWGAP